MTTRSSHPYRSLRLESVELVLEAAGLAPACAFETSQQWHAMLVAAWRKQRRRKARYGLSSFASLSLALVLVIL